jgi:hypothetical protein
MAAVFVVAKALHSAPLSAEETSVVRSQTPSSVALAIAATIHEGLPIEFDANKQLAWGPEGSACFVKYVTDIEIPQTVNGVMTYFRIKQTGHSLNSLAVKPIEAAREVSIGSPLVSPGHQPGLRVDTNVGVVSLNAQHEPVTRVEDNYGQVLTTEVGVTRTDCQNSISD